jgi:multiple sugar transport system substrate-binding protein
MKGKFNRYFLVLIVLLIATVSMGGRGICHAGKTTITFWHAANGEAMIATMRKLIKQFEVKNPDIQVKYQCIPWAEDPHFKYQTAVVGGNLADVITMGDPFEHVLAGANALEPLEPYLSANLKKEYSASLIRRCSYNGKLVALPWYVTIRGLFYRKDLLKEAGVPEPTSSWTWEQFAKYAALLTKDRNKDGIVDQYGFGTSGRYVSQFQPFLRQNGIDFIDEEKALATANSQKAVEALQFYVDLIRTRKVTPPGIATIDLQSIQKLFAGGKVAMFFDCEDTAISFAKEPALAGKFGVGLLPHKEVQASFAGGDVLAISRTSKNKKAAWKFVQFILTTQNVAEYCKVTGFTPVQGSVLNNNQFLRDPIRQGFIKQMKAGSFYYFKSPKSAAYSRIIRAEVQEAIEGKKSVQQVADDIQAQLTKELQN